MSHIHFRNKTLQPGKVLCVGRNYVEHIEELQNTIPDQMVLFHKPHVGSHQHIAFFPSRAASL